MSPSSGDLANDRFRDLQRFLVADPVAKSLQITVSITAHTNARFAADGTFLQ